MVKIPRIPQINGKVGLRAAEDRRRQAPGPRPQKKTKTGHKKLAGLKQRKSRRKFDQSEIGMNEVETIIEAFIIILISMINDDIAIVGLRDI